ncbi:MAG: DMT family transporter [Bacteroidota bacterium]
MSNYLKQWIIFILLCSIWGSSFILMKLGMYDVAGQPLLNPYQVAALRIFSAGIALIPFFLKAHRRIPAASRGYIVLSGLLGNFLPAFLFCIAETKIDSALTAMLNTLTPICALLVTAIVYHKAVGFNQWLGVLTGFAGCLLLFISKISAPAEELVYAVYVIVATICYGLNVNMVRQKLSHIASLDIAAGAFAAFIIPSALVLFATGFHELPLTTPAFAKAVAATIVLGVIGTAIASIIFYMLVKIAGPVFSSMVTYGIPFIAIFWGLLYGEQVTILQVVGLVIILSGVYLASSRITLQSFRYKKNPVSSENSSTETK